MYTKDEIVSCIMESSKAFHDYAGRMPGQYFTTRSATGRWSAAEHLEHLIRSIKPLNRAIALPLPVLRVFGRPNRPGRTYNELKQRYREKLSQGGAATGRYIPRLPKQVQRDRMLEQYQRQVKKLVCRIDNLEEAAMDAYLLPHPLLGKITLREMFFFTIYHTYHHLDIIKRTDENM